MSDAGMSFDGMYWHYVDKWLFALARFAREAQDGRYAAEALGLAREVHPAFFRSGRGMLWKLNVDLTPIRGLEDTGPNGDALAAWVVYHVVDAAAAAEGTDGGLAAEIAALQPVVRKYTARLRLTTDPLGYGLDVWLAGFLGAWAAEYRAAMTTSPALLDEVLDVRSGMELPFRLYGALIGAKLSRDTALASRAETLLRSDAVAGVELGHRCGEREHSGINKVMFATALDPLALEPLESEPPLSP